MGLLLDLNRPQPIDLSVRGGPYLRDPRRCGRGWEGNTEGKRGQREGRASGKILLTKSGDALAQLPREGATSS